MPTLTANLLAVISFAAIRAHAAPPSDAPVPERHVVGRVRVQPRPGLSLAELDNVIKPHDGRRGQLIQKINVHVIELPPQANAATATATVTKQ